MSNVLNREFKDETEKRGERKAACNAVSGTRRSFPSSFSFSPSPFAFNLLLHEREIIFLVPVFKDNQMMLLLLKVALLHFQCHFQILSIRFRRKEPFLHLISQFGVFGNDGRQR